MDSRRAGADLLAARRCATAGARMKRLRTAVLLTPGTLWLGCFFALPMLLMLAASVLHRGEYGGVTPGFTLEHYRRLLDPLYLTVLGRTLLWAFVATVTCLLLGYPVAWTIARSRRHRTLLLMLIVLPIYASLEKLDPALLEASATLGARPAAQFFTVILPLSLPGVIAGSLLVFVSALGSFVTSDLLGGAKQVMIGNLAQSQFTTARNWPFGSG